MRWSSRRENIQGLPQTLEGDVAHVGSATYNALGQMTELGFGSWVTTTYTYYGEDTPLDPGDDSFRLKQISTFTDSATLLQLEYA